MGPRLGDGLGRDDDLVHLAVPAAYVDHIVALIEDLDRRARPLPTIRRHRPVGVVPDVEWPVEELSRFAQGRSRTHVTVIAILDLLSAHPGQRFLVSDLATALGSPPDKIIGALGGLTRIVKAYHDYPRLGLPLRRVSEPVPGRPAIVRYSVDAEQAQRWRAVRAAEAA